MPDVCVPQSGGRGMVENENSIPSSEVVLLAPDLPPNTQYVSDRVLLSPVDGQVLTGKKN